MLQGPQTHQRLDVIIVGIDDGIVYFRAGWTVPGGMQQEGRTGVAATVIFIEQKTL